MAAAIVIFCMVLAFCYPEKFFDLVVFVIGLIGAICLLLHYGILETNEAIKGVFMYGVAFYIAFLIVAGFVKSRRTV